MNNHATRDKAEAFAGRARGRAGRSAQPQARRGRAGGELKQENTRFFFLSADLFRERCRGAGRQGTRQAGPGVRVPHIHEDSALRSTRAPRSPLAVQAFSAPLRRPATRGRASGQASGIPAPPQHTAHDTLRAALYVSLIRGTRASVNMRRRAPALCTGSVVWCVLPLLRAPPCSI